MEKATDTHWEEAVLSIQCLKQPQLSNMQLNRPRIGNEGPVRNLRYTSILSLTSEVDGGELPGRFAISQNAGWVAGSV